MLGPENPYSLDRINNLAVALSTWASKYDEDETMHPWELEGEVADPEYLDTLNNVSYISLPFERQANHGEAQTMISLGARRLTEDAWTCAPCPPSSVMTNSRQYSNVMGLRDSLIPLDIVT